MSIIVVEALVWRLALLLLASTLWLMRAILQGIPARGLLWLMQQPMRSLSRPSIVLATVVGFILLVVAVAYSIYRYLTWIGPGQRTIAVAFVGNLLFKLFIIHGGLSVVRSKAFQVFKD